MLKKVGFFLVLSSFGALGLVSPVGCGSSGGGGAGGSGQGGSPATAGSAGSAGAGGASSGGGAGTSSAGTGGASGGQSGGAGGVPTGGTGGAPICNVPPPATGPGANLIVNGDAEAAVGSTDGTAVCTPGWTATGEATTIQYNATGYLASTDPGPPSRGNNFFAGGDNDALSSLTQTVDVSADATAIDAAQVTYVLSGYLGGYDIQEDAAALQITFQSATAAALGTASIGPVTAEDRNNVTGLYLRTTTGSVPAGTRSIQVTLTMTRVTGDNNDGYADNLSLVLSGV
jgi:hypothetical protein